MVPELVTGSISAQAKLVRSGNQRGTRYEIYYDPYPSVPTRQGVPVSRYRSEARKRYQLKNPYSAVVYTPYTTMDDARAVEPEEVGRATTLEGAVVHADRYIEKIWRHETFSYGSQGYPKHRRHLSMENPIMMNSSEKIGVGVALAAGVAAAIYYWTRPAAAATTAPAATSTATLGVTVQSGPQSVSVQAGTPLSIALPPGGKWTAPIAAPYVGTNTPIAFPAPPASAVGQAVPSFPLTWTDSTGAAQTTTMTLTVIAAS